MRMHRKYPSLLAVIIVALVLYTIWMNVNQPSYTLGENSHTSVFFVSSYEDNSVSRSIEVRKHFAMVSAAPVLYCHIYAGTDSSHVSAKCVDFKAVPHTMICIHSQWTDMYISHDLLHTGTWEPHVLTDFLDVLKRDSTLGVIDIGANIGVYSLAAAALGRHVIAVEPFLRNIQLLHKSVEVNQYGDRVTLVNNAIADRRSNATVRESGDDQGDVRVELGVQRGIGARPQTVQTIHMDDLIEVMTFHRAVIKIDCQGYEHKAFIHSSRLLQLIYVPYIYMEWDSMAAHYKHANHSSTDKDKVQDLLHYFIKQSFRPYSVNSQGSKALDISMWHKWPFDIVWRLLPNEREYQKLLSNHFLNWPSS